MPDFRTCDTPQKGGPAHFVRRLKANELYTFHICSTAIEGLWSHWTGKKSLPCLSPRDSCAGCKAPFPVRQRFYLFGYNPDEKDYEFLELPPGAARDFLVVFPKTFCPRGQRVQIKRGNGKKAHLKIEVLSPHSAVATWDLAASKSAGPVMAQLWGYDARTVRFRADNEVEN